MNFVIEVGNRELVVGGWWLVVGGVNPRVNSGVNGFTNFSNFLFAKRSSKMTESMRRKLQQEFSSRFLIIQRYLDNFSI